MKKLRKSYPYLLIAYGALSVLFVAGFAYRAGSEVPGDAIVKADSTKVSNASNLKTVSIKTASAGAQSN